MISGVMVGEDASLTINTVGMKLKTPGNMVDFTKMGMNRMKWQIPVPWLWQSWLL
ncbi:hypothetical protein [Methanobacterium ferruginis]|uniref:hypothetical protein n=1 Tax=Methanobacterium ferruginis TaxID=710191 RepID=UPI002573030B|nr:hypothetical protein [Methanobacterium ferruginis]